MHFFLFLWLCVQATVNHCPLWANHVLHPVFPHCYANLRP